MHYFLPKLFYQKEKHSSIKKTERNTAASRKKKVMRQLLQAVGDFTGGYQHSRCAAV